MILFNREFEKQFMSAFDRLKPEMSQELCYGASMSCMIDHNMAQEKVAELRHVELLSYRTFDIWNISIFATDRERRLTFLYRLAYVLKEGWGTHIGIMQDVSDTLIVDVIREIEWLLNDREGVVRFLTLDDATAKALTGVGYMWHYQDWIDIAD